MAATINQAGTSGAFILGLARSEATFASAGTPYTALDYGLYVRNTGNYQPHVAGSSNVVPAVTMAAAVGDRISIEAAAVGAGDGSANTTVEFVVTRAGVRTVLYTLSAQADGPLRPVLAGVNMSGVTLSAVTMSGS